MYMNPKGRLFARSDRFTSVFVISSGPLEAFGRFNGYIKTAYIRPMPSSAIVASFLFS